VHKVSEIKMTCNNLLEDRFNFSSTTINNRMVMKMTTVVMETSTETMAGIRVRIQLTWITCLSLRGTSTLTVTSRDWASTLVIRRAERTKAEECGIGMTEMVTMPEDTDESTTFIIKLMKLGDNFKSKNKRGK
jgi:hypothetical protein